MSCFDAVVSGEHLMPSKNQVYNDEKKETK